MGLISDIFLLSSTRETSLSSYSAPGALPDPGDTSQIPSCCLASSPCICHVSSYSSIPSPDSSTVKTGTVSDSSLRVQHLAQRVLWVNSCGACDWLNRGQSPRRLGPRDSQHALCSPRDRPPHPHVHADTIKRGSKCRHSDLRTEAQERPCPGGVATPALGLCGSSGVLSVPGRMHTLKDWSRSPPRAAVPVCFVY